MDIKELVEWVADIALKYKFCDNMPAKDAAKQILSHPDLALIKYCECGGKGYEEGGDGAPCWHVECAKCHDTGIIVIPLRDAMKEAQANGH